MLISFLRRKRDVIKTISPFVLFLYILLSSIPSTSFEAENNTISILSNSLIGLLYRVFLFIVLAVFSITLMIAFKCEIKREIVFFSFVYLFLTIISTCVLPLNFTFLKIGTTIDNPIYLDITPDTTSLIYSIFQPFVFVFFVITGMSIFPKVFDKKGINTFLTLIVVFSVFLSIYAILFQSGFLEKILHFSKDTNRIIYKSIFTNKNVFSKYLFFGLFSSSLSLGVFFKKKRYLKIIICSLIIVFLFVVCFISESRTPFIVFLLSIFIMIFFIIFYSTGKHKNKLLCIYFAFVLVFFASCIIILFVPSTRIGVLKTVYSYLSKVIELLHTGAGRTEKIGYTLNYLMLYPRTLFGFGDRISIDILNTLSSNLGFAYMTQNSFDNTLLTVFAGHGLFGVILYCFIIIVVIKTVNSNNKHREISSIIFNSFFVGYIIYGFSETMLLFSSSFDGAIATILFVSIPISLSNTRIDSNDRSGYLLFDFLFVESCFSPIIRIAKRKITKKAVAFLAVLVLIVTSLLCLIPHYSLFFDKKNFYMVPLFFVLLGLFIIALCIVFIISYKQLHSIDTSSSTLKRFILPIFVPLMSSLIAFVINGFIYSYGNKNLFLISPFLQNLCAISVLILYIIIYAIWSLIKNRKRG